MSAHLRSVIIGAGVAGLATAIRLAVAGIEVTVYEKNSYPGGKLSHFTLNGYSFDAGPSLFTQPGNIIELFTLANESLEDYFEFEKVPVSCKYFYENGTIIHAYGEAEKFAHELEKQTGENYENVLSYLQQSQRVYDNIGTVFLDNSLHKPKKLLRASLYNALKTVRPVHIFRSLNELNTIHFNRPETVQLFNRFATYNGSNPYQAPGMLSLIPHLELNIGTYYPMGGMKSITDALYRLALKKGVRFHFNCSVQRIIHVDRRVRGVVVNNTNCYADTVVSNADVYFTYKYLLNDEIKARRLLKQERSSSAVIFYWGMAKNFPNLQLHNIFFSRDYRKEFDELFVAKNISDDPTVYINITAKMEEEQAPAGKENWFVMVNAPANEKQDWPGLVARCRSAVIKKLNRMLGTDLEPLIEVEETLDPVKMEHQTGSFKGALYGTSSNSKMAAFIRHPNFNPAIKGLFFAGGTVHPGGGIPLCLKSAKLVGELVQEELTGLVKQH